MGGVEGGDLSLVDLVLVLIGDLLGLGWEEKKLVILGRLFFLGVSLIYLVMDFSWTLLFVKRKVVFNRRMVRID